MRRRLWFRVSAIFAALWITVALVEPPGAHPCPMHSPGVSPVADQGDVHRHHAPSTAAADAESPDAPDDHAGQCLCLGDCTGSSSGLTATSATVVSAPTVPVANVIPAPPAHEPLTRVGLVLPFANGPPRAS